MMFTCEEVEKGKGREKVNQICVNEQSYHSQGPLGEIMRTHFRIVPLRVGGARMLSTNLLLESDSWVLILPVSSSKQLLVREHPQVLKHGKSLAGDRLVGHRYQ